MNKIYGTLPLLTLLVACSSTVSDGIVIHNETLAEAYLDFPTSMAEQRESISFSDGKEAETCRQYNSYVSEASVSESVRDMLVKSEYLTCEALELLRLGDSVASTAHDHSAGRMIYEKLDIRALPLSVGRVIPSDKKTFSDLVSDSMEVGSKSMEINYSGATISLELVAISDLNGNDVEDWIVWFSDEMQDGNYRAYQTLVIFDVDGSEQLKTAEVVNF